MRKAILALLFSAVMVYLPCWIEQANGSFRLAKIAADLRFDSAWTSDPPSDEMKALLAKPFHYLGRGAQAFVFESDDRQYVIKLFRCSPKIHPWRQFMRRNFLKRRDRRTAAEKTKLLFTACKLAYSEAPDLTGLVYIHLNPTNELSSTVLVNRMGRKIPLDLNRYCFAVQKKGVSVSAAFRGAVEDSAKRERLAASFVALVEERASRGISNLDKKMGENFGFLGEQAIEWDFGNYAVNPDLSDPEARDAEVRIFTRNLDEFLQTQRR